MLVIAGLHVALACGLTMLALRTFRIRGKARDSIFLAVLLLFVLVGGGHPPVLRAGTVFGIHRATRLLERETLSEPEGSLAARLLAWEAAAAERFTSGYLGRTALYEGLRPEEAYRAIRGWMMEKALYEFRYELKYRPANIFIPLEGIVTLATGGAR